MSPEQTLGARASASGVVRVPGDKSASHRALMLSALADGMSTIEGLSAGHDVLATRRIVEQMGARTRQVGTRVSVEGPPDGLRADLDSFYCGNSGTTMRLLTGLVSGVPGRHRLTGDASLSQRPMDRVAAPLNLMGADVRGEGVRLTAPLVVRGTDELRGLDYAIPVPSAQVKSAILLAGLSASGPSELRESIRTRTTTEDMLRLAGLSVRSVDGVEGRTITLTPGRPRCQSWSIPGDPSQAAFFAVLGTIHDDADITVSSIDASAERIGFVNVLRRMGANVELHTFAEGTSLRTTSARLRATDVHANEIPSVDEVPVLTVAAAAAVGITRFRNMGELRVKESDRFAGSMLLAELLGCHVWCDDDDFFVEGLDSARAFSNFSIDARLDHRIVMASAIAAVAGRGGTIAGSETVASSYPSFFDDLASLT